MNAEGMKAPENFPTIVGSYAGRILAYITWGYAVGLTLFLAGLEWRGEKNWILSVCLYMPIQVWMLPLFLLIPAAALCRPKLIWIHCGCLLLGMVIFGGLHMGARKPRLENPRSLTVVTNNIGQSNHQSMQPFLDVERPDLIALQDAANRGPAYSREYPDRFIEGRGEFVLISKYPIVSGSLVKEVVWPTTGPVAARFELSFKGGALVVYNVHMPTPRPDFFKLRHFGIIKELLGRNRRKSDGRSYAESMLARVELARKLTEVLRRETKPFIVVGDFNMPSHGCVYHLVASTVTDSFEKVGSGYGYSFPGVTSRALMLFGPWLRLVYLFAGKGWEPVYCRVEPHRPSQHRAVVARFDPKV
jgi:endonuclease/exonuclease/phosphatase (EEP) superfamily protein YafD